MTAKDRMLAYLPPYYRESRVMNAILNAQGKEIDKLNDAIDEVLKQFFISTATWGIDIWEEQYGLPVNENLNLQTRRQLVLAKKRSRRTSLLQILQAIEPTITLIWSRLRLPFTIYSAEDIYDFGPLVVLLERHKPAHLGYLFQLLPDIEASGYIIYANHRTRGRVNLEPKTGTVRTGRWPRWNTAGIPNSRRVVTTTAALIGNGIAYAAGWYSGMVTEKSTRGAVAFAVISPRIQMPVGSWTFPSAPSCGITPTISSLGTAMAGSVASRETIITGYCVFPMTEVSIGSLLTTSVKIFKTLSVGETVFLQSGQYKTAEMPVVAASGTVKARAASVVGLDATGWSATYSCGTIHAGEVA